MSVMRVSRSRSRQLAESDLVLQELWNGHSAVFEVDADIGRRVQLARDLRHLSILQQIEARVGPAGVQYPAWSDHLESVGLSLRLAQRGQLALTGCPGLHRLPSEGTD